MTKEEAAITQIKKLIKGSIFQDISYLCGGAVRDIFLNRPIKDIDIVVEMPDGGVKLADFLCETHPDICKNRCTFQNFGTAKFTMITDLGEVDVETVHTRKEVYRDKESRNPETCYGTLLEDVYRRDFTIGALFQNITTGEILDLTGIGIQDIKNKKIRCVREPLGVEQIDITFIDDGLRSMRAVRMAAVFDFEITPETLDGIKRNTSRLSIISKERISDELGKILCCNHPMKGLELLRITGLLHEIIPEFDDLIGMTQNQHHWGTVWDHTLSVVSYTQPVLKNRLAALFHDIGKSKTRTIGSKLEVHFYNHETVGSDMAYDIMRRLKMPLDVIEDVCFVIEQHMRTKSFGDDTKKISDKAIRKLQSDLGDRLDLVLDVIHADNMSHSQNAMMPNQKDNIFKRINLLKEKGLDCEKIILPVNGDDVMAITGISPGPKVKEILNILKEQYLENPTITRDECIKIIKNSI